MKMKVSYAALCMVVLVVVLAAKAGVTRAADCNVMQLAPCLGAFTSSAEPSANCCNKLREQQSCLCGYFKNPMFRPYIDSPNAQKVSNTCSVPFPTSTCN